LDAEDARTIGARVRQIRNSRAKSQEVIAGLAGISAPTLSRIENGTHALDSISQIMGLARALQIPPSELMRLPVPAPANGNTDSTTEAVRLTLDAIEVGRPDGLVLPVDVLRDRVTRIHQSTRACQFVEVAAALPRLIADLHTTLNTGRDHGELLALAVHLHVHVTRMWLGQAGAPADLRRRVVFLARHLAQEQGTATVLGMAAFGVADVLAGGGAFTLALAELDDITLPPTTAATVGTVSALTVTRALLAVVAGRPGDVADPMDAAADMADRFGELGEADSAGLRVRSDRRRIPPCPASAGGERTRPCGEHRRRAAPRTEPVPSQSRLPLGGLRTCTGQAAATPGRRGAGTASC
jgi:transcriptional regulator with XRE-family HTH domain